MSAEDAPEPPPRLPAGRRGVTVTLADGPREQRLVRLWEVPSGREIRRFPIEGSDSHRVAFSPDGKMLAASYVDGTIRLFDPASGKELARLAGDGMLQGCLAFSPDGRILATGDWMPNEAREAAAIHLWDVARRTRLHRLPMHDRFVFELAFSPDGKTLASAEDKFVRLWEVSTGRDLFPTAVPRLTLASLVVSPTDGSVITGGYDNTIRRWDPATGRELGVIGTHPDPVSDLTLSDDGRFLLSSSPDARVRVRNLTEDGRLVLSPRPDATVRLWDLGGGSKSSRPLAVNPESRALGLALSRDGRLATAAGRIFDVATGRELAILRDEEGRPFHPWAPAAFTPDAGSLVVTNGLAIWLFDVASGRTVQQIAEPGGHIRSISLSPDGRFLAAGVDRSIRLWHVPTSREVEQEMKHDVLPKGSGSGHVVVAFSPDGRLLLSGSGGDFFGSDPSVRVWEVASGQEVRRFIGHRAGVYAVAFFPDGRRIASASADATAMVWDLALPDQSIHANPTPPTDADSLWAELNHDANRAYQAIWTLVALPELALPILSDRLEPIQSDDPTRDTSIGPIASGETLRRLRAIAVLEKIGTREARRVLERLATGLDGRARRATSGPRCGA